MAFLHQTRISVQNIGYRSTWSVIIGIGIGPEKHISVDPYFVDLFMPKHIHYTLTKIQKVKKHHRTHLIFLDSIFMVKSNFSSQKACLIK